MNKVFTEIADGLDDAIAHAKGEATNVIEHSPETIDVKAIRKQPKTEYHHQSASRHNQRAVDYHQQSLILKRQKSSKLASS